MPVCSGAEVDFCSVQLRVVSPSLQDPWVTEGRVSLRTLQQNFVLYKCSLREPLL